MMKKLIIILLLSLLNANDNNISKDSNKSKEQNSSKKISTLQINIQKEIEREKKYKKEQKFYMGKDYNLSEHKVDPKSLDKIELIKPDLDFEMLEF